ncbi:MAG: TonB-dependent receptor [Vicinamibacterales bacterium]
MTIIRTLSAVAVLLVTCLTPAAYGQANNGRVTGSVLDPSGGVLPGASVTLRNLGTNASSEATTDGDGRFSFPEQPIGRYQLSVSIEGFRTAVLSDVTLLTGQLLDLKVPLQVGDITSSVDVTGGVPLVQAGSSTVQTSMTERQVQELPLNGRNPLQLVALTAGATITDAGTVAGQQDNRGISVNGLRTTQNNFRLDGSNYTNRFFGSAPILPNPDTLQEFTVQSANYSARTAGAGALVELSTRSGTNAFHGSGFEFLRNTSLNANNFFINARPLTAAQLAAGVTEQPKPPFKLNQYGGTLGGPIVKNRAFFFGSYQGTRQRSSPSSVTIQSLTAAQRNGDFSSIATPIIDPRTGTQFVTNGRANVIPVDRLDPTVRRVLDTYLPLPDSGNNLLVIQDRDVDDDQYTGKVDLVSGKNYLSARYTDDDNNFQRPFAAPTGFYAANNFRNRSLSVRDTYTLSANLLVTVSGAYSKFRRIQEPQAPGLQTLQSFGVNAPQTIETSFFPGVRFVANPAFQLFSGGGLEQTPSSSDFHGTAVWTRGAHVLQFGSDLQFDQLYTLDASFTPGTWTFNGQRTGVLLADVVLGLPSQFQQDSGRTNDLRESKYHFWIQDDWKVRPRLTLNLGLRWEPKLPPIDKLNNLVGFVRGQQSTVAPNAPLGLVYPGDQGIDQEVFPRDYNNFAPRVGFAADVLGTGRTIVRGGYGVFFIDPALTIYTRTVSTQPSVITVTTVNPQSFLDPYAGVAGGNPFPRPRVQPDEFDTYQYARPVSGGVLDPNAATGYSQNWNLTVEQQLWSKVAVSAAYVGNLGVKILAPLQLNPAVYAPGATAATTNARRPYQGLSDVEMATPYQSSNYHSLQLNATSRASKGLTLLANYVWSKTIDNGSATVEGNTNWTRNSHDPGLDRGPADFDVRHRVNVTAIYDIPGWQGDGLVSTILRDWQVNGILTASTGLPFTVKSGTDRSLTAIGQDNADLVGDPSRPSGADVTQWFNPAAFVPAALGTFGTVGRNSQRGPGYASVDVALFRNIPITGRFRVQLRAEAFNALNHTNFLNPNATVTAGTNFGRILSAYDPRVIQFGLKLQF